MANPMKTLKKSVDRTKFSNRKGSDTSKIDWEKELADYKPEDENSKYPKFEFEKELDSLNALLDDFERESKDIRERWGAKTDEEWARKMSLLLLTAQDMCEKEESR